MNRIFLSILLIVLLSACASSSKIINKTSKELLQTEFYDNHFTGMLIIDPSTNDTLLDYDSEKYFIPASNTKIFSLYASLKMLPDSIPAFTYIKENDTTYIQGTGDPTLLHPYFNSDKVLEFLKGQPNLKFKMNNLRDEKLGPGWSWGDYQYYYQVERSALPLYGNVLTMTNSTEPKVQPSIFKDSILAINSRDNREQEKNIFYFDSNRKDTLEVPFRTSEMLSKSILESELGKDIVLSDDFPVGPKSVFYSMPKDTVLKRMMHVSDNFIADQLLILASSTLSDTLSIHKAQKYVLENFLNDLKQEPRWVDGSGLSRYNLISPKSIVHVLHEMYRDIERERLLSFFPAGGASGTLKRWYPGDPEPYVYAKTGSLSNNHCLSGFIKTKSGKTLIFSFMNNHFRKPSSEIKKRMQTILETVRDTY
ncbi:D-alanyl-D-alanine carboxypeptidase/D-alanyl-D-alanine-endopeptidase [Euzebyella saccharophila]|uniref:D-alanyl-D-alanine carboxypeptidase/D-alanyl-D-alanine-endopeptidase n=1 Tax=Euzebyella saccharophila TaxID=679664 RepID=A0ABV8JU38_9FLAO|nr:D-alanyl-D-alanine carboxypeptidase [Euzebyella saccharophila]